MAESHPTTVLREKALFMQALEIEAHEARVRFLDERCGEDLGLRSRLNHLLEINEDQDGPIDPSRYVGLLAEQDQLTQELFEEGRFLSGLGHSIRRLGEDYELIEEIGRGSAGVVYRARQISLNREVAVKVIHGSALACDTERERFQVEVEAAAGLKHPNILPVFEIGRHDSYDYFSMPLMQGGTLTGLIGDRSLPPRKAARLMVKICRTVHAAHRGGIIHRDLKPDNILLDRDGEPHISDFGLAYRLEQHQTLTITGGIMGTPHYMAPEQADPRVGPVTTSTDVYSLGVILYQMLTGHQPFRHDSLLKVLEMVKSAPPRSPRAQNDSVDRDLETIVLKCLEKRPAARYDSSLALAEDLEAWLDHRPIAARPASAPGRLWKWARRRPTHALLALITALFVLTLGVGGPLIALQQTRYRQAADQARAHAEQQQLATEQQRLATEEQRRAAERAALENRSLAYSYSTRLAAAVANTDRASLASHGMLRALIPSSGQSDMRGWEWYYLFAEVYLEPRRLEGKGRPVQAVSFSPSGHMVAISNRVGDGTLLHQGSHFATVRALNDPGTKHLAYLWRRDGGQLLTRSEDGQIKVWNPRSGRQLAELPEKAVVSLGGWLSDERVVGLTSDNEIKAWDLSDLSSIGITSLARLTVPGLRKISVSPDGRYLAGISDGPDVYLWRMEGLDERPAVFSGHRGTVTGMDWHRDSRWLATRGEDQVVRVWEVPGGARLVNVSDTKTRITALCWDPNGLQIMFAGEDGFLWLFDLATGRLNGVMDYETAITSLDWCNVTHSFVVGFADGSIEMRRFGLPAKRRLLNKKPVGWSSLRWSADGSAIGGPVADGQLLFLDALKGTVRSGPLKIAVQTADPGGWQPTGINPEPVTSTWHASSKRLATGNTDGSISVWDRDRQMRVAHFQTSSKTAPLVAWHPDGSRIASAGDDTTVHIWDWEIGESPLSLELHRPITDLAWSPGGMRLAASIHSGGIWVWDATAGYLMNSHELAQDVSP